MTEKFFKQPKPTSLNEAHAALIRILTPEQVEELGSIRKLRCGIIMALEHLFGTLGYVTDN